jgi:hypothetical protein
MESPSFAKELQLALLTEHAICLEHLELLPQRLLRPEPRQRAVGVAG